MMSHVRCSGCGRDYDVSRFEHGRTLRCACGERVGLPAPARRLAPGDAIRFAADGSLGGLAHWLRLLGHDCAHEAGLRGGRLVRLAIAEGRVILTRDRGLTERWRVSGVHVVLARTTRKQLSEVHARFDLVSSMRPLSRCAACNRPVRAATAEAVAGRVPASVIARGRTLSVCSACDRVYWDGTHAAAIRGVAARLAGLS